MPQFYSVYMLDLNNAWTVGELGTILHWDGTQWTTVTSSTMYVFYSVFMTGPDDGWAVGKWGTLIPQNYTNVVLHWNGTQWAYVGGPTKIPLNSVYMVESNNGWAVGADGTIIRWNGIQWVPEFSATEYVALMVILTLVAVIPTWVRAKKRKDVSWNLTPLTMRERHNTSNSTITASL
jgi:hypothetical protein